MATFKDKQNRDWEIKIDAPTILRIREDCDPDFLLNDGDKQNTYLRLQADPVLLCTVIFMLCAKERDERGISDEDFYGDVIGDAIDNATGAMLDAIANFTPKRTRAILKSVAARTDSMHSKVVKLALEKINDPALEEELMKELSDRIDADVQRVLTQLGSATSSQDLSE